LSLLSLSRVGFSRSLLFLAQTKSLRTRGLQRQGDDPRRANASLKCLFCVRVSLCWIDEYSKLFSLLLYAIIIPNISITTYLIYYFSSFLFVVLRKTLDHFSRSSFTSPFIRVPFPPQTSISVKSVFNPSPTFRTILNPKRS